MNLLQSVLSRATAVFSRSPLALPAEPIEKTEAKAAVLSVLGKWSNAIWKVDPERKPIYDDIENMDDNDEIVSQALDTIAEVAIGLEEGFTERFSVKSENSEALKILNQFVLRTKLRSECKDIIRKMIKHGNEFREVIIGTDFDGKAKIMELREDIPAYTIYPNFDDNGRVNAKYPWVQKTNPWFWGKEVQFEPWQLVHWRYGERSRKISKPFLVSARRGWKRLQAMEDTMALARMVRAYLKIVHYVPVHPRATVEEHQKAIENYKQNKDKKEFYNFAQGTKHQLDNPITVDSDIYVPEDGSGRAKVDTIDPKNSNLTQIDDVQFAQSKLICRLGVPRPYLNIEGSQSSALNQGDTTSKADVHFARKIRDVQSSFIDGLSFLFNLELLLNGIKPFNEDGMPIYEISMSRVNMEDAYQKAQAENTMAEAATKWAKFTELPEELVIDKFMNLTDKQRQKYTNQIKFREKPNAAFQTGGEASGAPSGQRAGSEIKRSTPSTRR